MTTVYKQVTFRPGAELTHELKARGDNINDVARECVRRYLAMVADVLPDLYIERARELYRVWSRLDDDQRWVYLTTDTYDYSTQYPPVEAYALTDALERCSRLLTQGVELDQALREVGLVR